MEGLRDFIKAFYVENRPASNVQPKKSPRIRDIVVENTNNTDTASIKPLENRLKATFPLSSDAENESFAIKIDTAIQALSPESNALYRNRHAKFLEALSDPNAIALLSNEICRPEPFLIVLRNMLVDQNSVSEMSMYKTISFSGTNFSVSPDVLREFVIALINSPLFIAKLADEGASNAWEIPAVRAEVFEQLGKAGVTEFNVIKSKHVVRFLFPKAGGVVDKLPDVVKAALKNCRSSDDIDSNIAASIQMNVSDARKQYATLYDSRLDGLPFSEQQTTVLVGAKIMGSLSWTGLAAGTHFNHSKSPLAIQMFMQTNLFANHFNSLSDDEKVTAALIFQPGTKESVIRAKLSQATSQLTKLVIDISDVPDQPLITGEEGKSGSKYKGVRMNRKKWIASIKIDGKLYASKLYETQEEAAHWFAKVNWKYNVKMGLAKRCRKS